MRISLNGQDGTKGSVLVLGMFDGVHLGHRVLLMRAKKLAKTSHVSLVACTFVSHPMALVRPEKAPPMLTTLEERAKLMEAQGVDILFAQSFDREKMNQPPEEYIGELCRQFHPVHIVAGYNFSFGKGGEGTPEMLAAMGGVFGYQAEIVPPITWGGQGEISSTVIREYLGQGKVKAARELLGRAYRREAAVVNRHGKWAELVMEPNGKQDVPPGVYRVVLEEGERKFPSLLQVVREGYGRAYLPEDLLPGKGLNLCFYDSKRG